MRHRVLFPVEAAQVLGVVFWAVLPFLDPFLCLCLSLFSFSPSRHS